MISAEDFQRIVADTFLGGDVYLAGILIYAVIVALILAIVSRYSMMAALVAVLPVTLICSMMGILSTDMMVLILIVAILGMALYSKVGMSWDPLRGRDQWGRRRE